ncbi:site-specific DNA-methyltransferase, partial [Candidatus Peregrinibacteria bacterium]|nr:site-specific DNA-methyltransferase [Candidatus Peregrinibacteria bacterium]
MTQTKSASAKRSYADYTKEELIAEIKGLQKRKKYGIVWEEKPEQVVQECKSKLPVLKEVKNRGLITDKGNPVNILIEGDNYHALSVLNYTHEKKIDVIYIDPPYNTGNKDFIFNDRYVDAEDSYRHSKWLSFIEKRLKLAKTLLKDNGVIFISIDDNEVASLKLLCDGIFGETCFRNIIVVSRVKKNIQERDFVKSLNLGHGYVLFYGRNGATIKIPTKFHEKGERWHAFDAPGIRPTMEYEIFGCKPPKGRHWMFEKSKADEMIKTRLLRPNPRTGKPQYKLEASTETRLDTNWLDLQEGSS